MRTVRPRRVKVCLSILYLPKDAFESTTHLRQPRIRLRGLDCRYVLTDRIVAPIEHPYTAMLAVHGPLDLCFPTHAANLTELDATALLSESSQGCVFVRAG